MEISDIERKIADNEIGPAQVFTQMLQHIRACEARELASRVEHDIALHGGSILPKAE